jgi:hypothetical protein
VKRVNLYRSFAITLPALTLVLYGFSRFLTYVEARPGYPLHDPILSHLPAHDLAIPIFAIIYTMIILCFVIHRRRPYDILVITIGYTCLTLFRWAAMYMVPLDPPAAMVVLKDPIVETLLGGRMITKDLFFSGHTSLLVLLSMSIPYGKKRYLFFFGTLLVAFMLLVQHAHYSVDVLIAPLFSVMCYRLGQIVAKLL